MSISLARPVRSLLAARDGRLWIGTDEGLASWNGRQADPVPGDSTDKRVFSLLEDREGTMWAGGTTAVRDGRLCAIHGGQGGVLRKGRQSWQMHVLSLYEDRSGDSLGRHRQGIWRWKPGPSRVLSYPDLSWRLAEADGGELLISTLGGIEKLVNGRGEPYPLRGHELRPSLGSCGIAMALCGSEHRRRSIACAPGKNRLVFALRWPFRRRRQYVSFRIVKAIFGSATSDGLDRFREFAIPTSPRSKVCRMPR